MQLNYRLPDGNYFHIHTNDEGYYYDILNRNGKIIDGWVLEYSNVEYTEEELLEELSYFTGINELRNMNKLKRVSQNFIDNLEENSSRKRINENIR